MSKVIGIIGTRRRNTDDDMTKVFNVFIKVFEKGDTICSGLCPKGGDRFAVAFADLLKCETLWFPANWSEYGKAAGFIRNADIAKNSDILIACVSGDRKGGTEDTIKKFVKIHGIDNLLIVGPLTEKIKGVSYETE